MSSPATLPHSTDPPAGTRVERDAIGSVEIPADALYGVHTVRALRAYPLAGPRLGDFTELLRAYAAVKIACARANASYGLLEEEVADAIRVAGEEVRAGRWNEEFPSPVLQGGGGVSTNMNINEVLANRASELLGDARGQYARVHPNDHVNRSQSTNDTYPTAVAISTMVLVERLIAALQEVTGVLETKASEYEGTQRLGRTCLRDALPVDVADTHRGQASAVRRAMRRLDAAALALQSVPLGATAVGTGAGAPDRFGEVAVVLLAEVVDRPLRPSEDYFDALAHLDAMSDIGHAVAEAAATLARIAGDLRLLSSGPRGGFNEVQLPAVSAGSSIMPGKTNPAIPELVMQVAMEMSGVDHVVEAAVRAGELELNVMEPVILAQLHPGIVKLTQTATVFARECLAGLAWNTDVLGEHLSGSLLEQVQRSERVGYATVAYGADAALDQTAGRR
ncbi:lyase family protein [Microbacterium sp. RD1]|uniref:lyase family protein n=1 Tax=Microbacterium sp. RD1 TaxID=3457313 RepID=UPI003FA60D24